MISMMYDVWFVLLPDCDLHMLSASPLEQKEEEEEKAHPNKSVSGLQCLHVSPSVCLVLRLQFNFHLRLLRTHPLPCRPRPFLTTITKRPFLWILDPPLSTSPPTWAVPWPQLITLISTLMFYMTVLNCFRLPSLFPLIIVCSSLLASRNSVEDAYYEDADNNYPITRINGPPKNSCEHSCLFSTITMHQTKNNQSHIVIKFFKTLPRQWLRRSEQLLRVVWGRRRRRQGAGPTSEMDSWGEHRRTS